MDCVGVHYNEGILGPDARSGDPRGNSGHYTRYYSRMFEVYAATFPGKPLCFTEIGYLSSEGYGPLPASFAWAANVTVADQAAWLGTRRHPRPQQRPRAALHRLERRRHPLRHRPPGRLRHRPARR